MNLPIVADLLLLGFMNLMGVALEVKMTAIVPEPEKKSETKPKLKPKTMKPKTMKRKPNLNAP